MNAAPIRLPRNRHRAPAWCVAAALGLAAAIGAHAGTILDNVADSQYTALAADSKYAAVGGLSGNSAGIFTGTLVAPGWVLTAAHPFNYGNANTTYTFTLPSSSGTSSRILLLDGWNGSITDGYDLALVKLSDAITSVDPAGIYTGTDELGKVITTVGFGETGTGTTGAQGGTQGTKRAGTNIVDQFGKFPGPSKTSDSSGATALLWDFDSPGSSALPLEYFPAEHDSGAPGFIDSGGRALVAAVISDALDPYNGSRYGDVAFATRVSAFQAWIEDHIINRWQHPNDGQFSVAANWSDSDGPKPVDIVQFGQSGDYSVSFTAPAASNQLLVRQGGVTFDLAGQTYAQTSPRLNGSVIVGQTSDDVATLTVSNGILSSVDAFVGAQGGANGQVVVTGSGAQWNLTNSLYIGGTAAGQGGSGAVTVQNGAALHVAETLKVWSGSALNLAGGLSSAKALVLTGGGLVSVADGASLLLGNAAGGSPANAGPNGGGIVSVGGTLIFTGPENEKDRINDEAALRLDGKATDRTATPSIRTAGLSEVTGLVTSPENPNGINTGSHGLGALTLTSDSVIDFAIGNTSLSILQFASLTATDPARILYITNWNGNAVTGGGLDQLRFDTSITGSINLNQIWFYNSAGDWLGPTAQISFGGYVELVPVPEADTVCAAGLLAGLAVWRQYRRRGKSGRGEPAL